MLKAIVGFGIRSRPQSIAFHVGPEGPLHTIDLPTLGLGANVHDGLFRVLVYDE